MSGPPKHQSSSTQLSLVPPLCEELTTREPFLSATQSQPARSDLDALGRDQNERPQIDVARRQARLGEDWHGRQRQGGLRDIIGGIGAKLLAEPLQFASRGSRANQHPVAARAVDFLDHQFGEIVEHVLEQIFFRGSARSARLEDRLLAGVELHDLGHVAVERLVVGDAHTGALAMVMRPAR